MVWIYGLRDPRDGAIRYIGRSIRPEERFRSHLKDSRNRRNAKALWIAGLTAANLEPELVLLEETKAPDVDKREREWIFRELRAGHELTNGEARYPVEKRDENGRYWGPTNQPGTGSISDKIIGRRLRGLRVSRGLSQREFGGILGLSNSAISYYEAGRRPLSTIMIARIEREFGVNLSIEHNSNN